ncbi:hypothetical protein H8958_014964 [Nasalis larvatus]
MRVAAGARGDTRLQEVALLPQVFDLLVLGQQRARLLRQVPGALAGKGLELEEIRKCGMKNFRNIQVDEANLLTWQGLIVPDNPPYDKGAFRIEINFPAEYPFKPPKITFKTKIYHPNIDEKGQVCLPVISAENWKPATKTDQVIQSLIALVNDPQPEHPLRADLAEEYSKDRKKFCKNAEEFTKKYGEKRPVD